MRSKETDLEKVDRWTDRSDARRARDGCTFPSTLRQTIEESATHRETSHVDPWIRIIGVRFEIGPKPLPLTVRLTGSAVGEFIRMIDDTVTVSHDMALVRVPSRELHVKTAPSVRPASLRPLSELNTVFRRMEDSDDQKCRAGAVPWILLP